MELDLSLGELLGPQKNKPMKDKRPPGLDFCMDFGLYFPDAGDNDPTSEEGGGSDADPPLQLGLLPRYENGSSENGSSGNRTAGAPEDALSANSVGSSLQVDFGLLKPGTVTGDGNLQQGGGSRGATAERASDDEDNAVNTRKKLRLSKEQSAFLEESFKEHNTLNPKQKMALAKQLSLRPRQVEVWFQNRRARTKLKQTEVDCEYLKRCCDALTEENRRLHKELQELRALKTSAPFYMQIPATTLTMCPSCERVSGAAAAEGKGGASSTTRPRFFPFQQRSHPHKPAAS